MKSIFELIFDQAKHNNENIVALSDNLDVVNKKIDMLIEALFSSTTVEEPKDAGPTASGTTSLVETVEGSK